MSKSKDFDAINQAYNADKTWKITRVRNVVGKAITAEEYEEITGAAYPASERNY